MSVHGGNRLGANSLLDTLVFGRRSGGTHAALAAKGLNMPTPPGPPWPTRSARSESIVGRDRSGRRVSEIRADLGSVMDADVPVFRDEDGLRNALEVVKRLKEEVKTVSVDDKGTVFNQDVLGAIELGLHARQRGVRS